MWWDENGERFGMVLVSEASCGMGMESIVSVAPGIWHGLGEQAGMWQEAKWTPRDLGQDTSLKNHTGL